MSTPIIQISSLSRRFGEKNAVDHLTLDVQAGEIFGFLGHNGAGKTTTVRMLNGVLEPTSGQACVLGLDPQTEGPAVRAQTGVLTETPSLDERLTARDNLSIYADLYSVPRADAPGRVNSLLTEFELADRADEQTFLIDYPYPANGNPILGELGETQFQFKFTGDKLSVTIAQIVFGGEPIVFEGTR